MYTQHLIVFLKKNPHVRGRRKKESFTTECSTVQYTLTLTQLTIWTSGNPRYFVCGQVSHQRNRGTGKSEVSHVCYIYSSSHDNRSIQNLLVVIKSKLKSAGQSNLIIISVSLIFIINYYYV